MQISKLSDNELRKLLKAELADIGTDGTGLYSQTNKIALNTNMHTLIIGIGGTGWRALANIKRYMLNNVRDYSNNVAFLAIDADTDELDKSILDPNTEVARVSVDASEADRELNIPENRSDYVKEWINPGYHVSHDEKGANKIRQAGRGKLYTINMSNGRPNDQLVMEKIAQVRSQLGQVSQVMIVAGLSGGSGSGMLINVAMLTKVVLQNLGPDIKAFCFLPDTIEQFCGINARNSLYANGYAALKELDYYAGLSQRSGFSDIFTATNGNSVTLGKDNLLFDSITLIGGSSSRQSYRDANEKAMDVFVESVVNMLSAGMQANVNNGSVSTSQSNQSVLSFLSNGQSGRGEMLSHAVQSSGTVMAGWYLDDNFCYSGIGVASASIPQKVCTSYIVSSIIRKIFRMNDPNAAATVGTLISDMPAIPESDARAAIYSIFGNNQNEFSYSDIDNAISDKTTVSTPDELEISREEMISNSLDSARSQYNYGKRLNDAETGIDNAIDNKFNSFRTNAIAFIKKYGPRALVYLYEGKTEENGKPVNFKTQKSMKELIMSRIPNDFSDDREKLRAKLKKDASNKFLWINAPKTNNVKSDLTALISAELRFEMQRHVYGDGSGKNALHTHFIDRVVEFIDECRDFDRLLTELNIIYRNLSVSFDGVNSFKDASDSCANINIISTQSAYDWAKGTLDAVIDLIRPADAMGAIVDDYFSDEHHSDWQLTETTGGMKLNARVRFEQVVAGLIRHANNNNNVVLTINDYITHCLATGDQNITQIMRGIALELNDHSDPLFKKGADFQRICPNSHLCVILPQNICQGPDGSAICTAFTNALGSNVNIYMSDVTDKIVFYKLEPSNPLYSLADLPTWENAYETSSLSLIHMNESGRGDFDPKTGLEWKNYPGCRCDVDARALPEFRKDSSLEYKFLTNEFDPNFEKALEYGIIREETDSSGGKFYKFYDISGDGWSYDISGYNETDIYGMPLPGAPLIDYIRQLNRAGDGMSVELFQNKVLTAPNAQRSDAETRKCAKRALRRNVRMYVAMKRSILRYEDMFKDISAASIGTIAATAFIKLIGAGLLTRNESKSNSFELQLDGKTTPILIATKFSKACWAKELVGLYDNGLEYAAAYCKFREIFASANELKEIAAAANTEFMKLVESDKSDAIDMNLTGLHGEINVYKDMCSDGAAALYRKLGIDGQKFEAAGIQVVYEICEKNF